MAKQFQLTRVSDGVLIKLAEEFVKNEEKADVKVVVLDGLSFGWSAGQVLNAEWKKTLGVTSFLITSISIEVPRAGFVLNFFRGQSFGIHNPGYGPTWGVSKNPFVDGIEITGPSAKSDRLDLLQRITKHLSLAPPGQASADSLEPLVQSSLILDRVSEAAATVVEHTVERQRELDIYREELEQRAEDEVTERLKKLDRDHEVALAAVQAREEGVKKQLSTLDDRENTHVRRELQAKMALLPEETLKAGLLNRSVWPFAIPVCLAALAVGVLMAFIVRELSNLDDLAKAITGVINDGMMNDAHKASLVENMNRTILFGQVRIAVQTVGAGLLVWFALRLASNRYRQISRWEHDLHRFRLDTERASFLVEGDLEARKLSQNGLPDVMLDRFSRGLFASGPSESGNDSDELGSTLGHLLGRAASVKLGTDGVMVEVDKAGMKRARRDVSRDAADIE